MPANTIFNVTSAEVDRNHRDGYYQNWNVAVGYELSRAAAVEVRYVGAKGSNLDTSLTNFNSPDPDPAAGAASLQARRPYPGVRPHPHVDDRRRERLPVAAERVQAARPVGPRT